MPFDAGRFGLALLVSALAVVVLVAVTAWWSHRAGKVAVVDVVWGLFFAAIGCSLLVVNPGARALLLPSSPRSGASASRRTSGHGRAVTRRTSGMPRCSRRSPPSAASRMP